MQARIDIDGNTSQAMLPHKCRLKFTALIPYGPRLWVATL